MLQRKDVPCTYFCICVSPTRCPDQIQWTVCHIWKSDLPVRLHRPVIRLCHGSSMLDSPDLLCSPMLALTHLHAYSFPLYHLHAQAFHPFMCSLEHSSNLAHAQQLHQSMLIEFRTTRSCACRSLQLMHVHVPIRLIALGGGPVSLLPWSRADDAAPAM